MPDVPAGLSGLTDRVLPYAFPTLDGQIILRDAGAERAGGVAAAAGGLGRRHELRAALRAQRATASTGRAPSIAPASSSPTARRARTSRGTAAASSSSSGWGRRPTASTRRTARSTPPTGPRARRRTRSAGWPAQRARWPYSEGDVGAAAAALRRLADVGPSHRVGTAQSVHALAPFFAALALVAVALDLVRRYLRPAGGVSLVRRHRKDATVGV